MAVSKKAAPTAGEAETKPAAKTPAKSKTTAAKAPAKAEAKTEAKSQGKIEAKTVKAKTVSGINSGQARTRAGIRKRLASRQNDS